MSVPEIASASLPEISIVIPAYQASRFVGAALTSVQKQTISRWELVLVDDGSADNTRILAEQYAGADPRMRVLSQPNAGPSAARNHGYAATSPTTKYIIFLDADDVWQEDTLETLVGVLERCPDALAAYGVAQYITSDGQLICDEFADYHQRQRWGIEGKRIASWATDRPTTFAVEALMERIITSGTVLIRRKAFETTGLWNTDLRMWEDWDLWLRLSLKGDIAFTDKVVLSYRKHDANLSNDQHALETGELRARQRLIAMLTEDTVHRAIAITGFRKNKQCISLQFWGLAKRAWLRQDFIGALKWARHAIINYWKYLYQYNQLSKVTL